MSYYAEDNVVDLMSQCIVVLKRILEQESKGWYIKYKDRLITELKGLYLAHCVLLLIMTLWFISS